MIHGEQPLHISQTLGRSVLTDPDQHVVVARKRSRVIALRMDVPFTVETDRGDMSGVPGDYLVTNHPEDDPGSDVWTISAERMKATYEPVP